MVLNSTVRKSILITLDSLLVICAFYAAYLMRFDGRLGMYQVQFENTFLFVLAIFIVSNVLFGLYRKMWRYASIPELMGIFWASTLSTFVSYAVFWGLKVNIPRSVLLLTGIFSIFFIGGTRFTYRIVRVNRALQKQDQKNQKRTLIIGAGDAGANLIKELLQNDRSIFNPIAVLDDADWKQHTSIHGIAVKGKLSDIERISELEEIEQIIIAIPSTTKKRIKEVTQRAQMLGIPVKTLPNINDLLTGKIELSQLRNIEITDLLGREEVKLDISGIKEFIENQVVMVTGGGGSIGSEICRQLIPFKPKQLIILDNYENNAYDLQQELKYKYPLLNLKIRLIFIVNAIEIGK